MNEIFLPVRKMFKQWSKQMTAGPSYKIPRPLQNCLKLALKQVPNLLLSSGIIKINSKLLI